MVSMFMDQFSFTALWNPSFMILTIALGVAYLWIVGSAREHIPGSAPVPKKQKVTFLIGLVVFYFAYGGPLYILGHVMFSAHMAQMGVLFFVAPPLLLLGSPSWFFTWMNEIRVLNRIYKAVLNPFIGLILFNVLLSFYHLPSLLDFLMMNYTLHRIFQFLLFSTALLMWWHIVAPVPDRSNLSELKRIAYLFGNSGLLLPACAMIIFATGPLYATYNDPNLWSLALGYCLPPGSSVPPELFSQLNLFSPGEDQQLGGIIMKLAQETMFMTFLVKIFTQWVRREKKVANIEEYQRPYASAYSAATNK